MKTNRGGLGGGTGVAPVQFGVAPNCRSGGAMPLCREDASGLRSTPVSGVTPETTGRRPVPPGPFQNLSQA